MPYLKVKLGMEKVIILRKMLYLCKIIIVGELNTGRVMTKKRKKSKSGGDVQKQSAAQPKIRKNFKYKDALISTLIALGGIYAAFMTLIFVDGSHVVDDLFEAQSLLGGLYVNLFAMVGVAYSKFAKEIFLHSRVFWLCLIEFIIMTCIFAQSRAMKDAFITLDPDWLESPYVSIVLQILFAILIFAIATQKELSVKVVYKKKIIN